jgi:hypothetical protein
MFWIDGWIYIRALKFATITIFVTWYNFVQIRHGCVFDRYSFYYPKLKPHLKGQSFWGQLKMSRQLHWGLWTASQLKTFSTAMKSSRNAGIAEFDHNEPILKGKNCNCMYVQQNKFILNHSHYFWDRSRILQHRVDKVFIVVHFVIVVIAIYWIQMFACYDTQRCT